MRTRMEPAIGSGRPVARARPCRVLLHLLPGLLSLGVPTASVCGASLVGKGETAPDWTLPTLSGETVKLAELRGRFVLLLFGELYNRNSIGAAKDVADILGDQALADVKASAFMVITQRGAGEALRDEVSRKGVAFPVLRDDGRRTFAAYRVMVLPSLVVVDPEGKTALACAGYPLDFRDMVVDTILLAAHGISPDEFERRRGAATRPAASENQVRAIRLAALAEQLTISGRAGSEDLAIDNFRNAIKLDPNCGAAHLGLGRLLLERKELEQAEAHFRRVRQITGGSVEASIGLVRVHITRGGADELALADKKLRGLSSRRRNDPRVVYLAGLVAEKSGDANGALEHYKRAAELLLYGQSRRWEVR